MMKIINVMAVSLDGRIARHSHEPDSARAESGFAHPDDHAHLLRLLAHADAVVIGARTLLASGGALEVDGPQGRPPRWYVATRSPLPGDAHFWRQTRIPRTLVVPKPWDAGLAGEGVDLLAYDAGASWPRAVVEDLEARGARTVLLLGGAVVNREFYAAGLVDELIVTVLPIVVGQQGAVPLVEPDLPTPLELTLTASQAQGDLVFLTYKRREIST
jgi:5-amino-6-(5-phosphoribosylamino)uracil reductase